MPECPLCCGGHHDESRSWGKPLSPPPGTGSLKLTRDPDEENNERQRVSQRADPVLSESKVSFSRE